MDIQSILQDDKKKKTLIIVLIAIFLLFLVGGSVYYFFSQSSSQNNGQILGDITTLNPRDGTATSTLKRLPLIELAADHTTVAPGQTSKISWTASNATTCKNGAGDSIDLSGNLSISPTEPYTFDVLCTGPNGTQSQSITISVSTAPIIELIAVPAAVESGKQTYISWNTTNADRCEDSKGGTLRLTGGFSVKPTAPYTFSMSCTGEKGTTKKSITVRIASPFASSGSGNTGNTITDNANGNTFTDTGLIPANGDGTSGAGSGKTFSASVTASPTNVAFNGTSRITWKVTNLVEPNYCIIKGTNQSKSYLPGLLTTYNLNSSVTTPPLTSPETVTLTCWQGDQQLVKTVTVTVGEKPPTPNPQIPTFSVTVANASAHNYAAAGSTLVAKWSTNAAAKVSACVLKRNGTPVDGVPNTSNAQNLTGSKFTEYQAGLNTYTLTCTGESGTITGATTTGPSPLAIVDCSFPNGFGNSTTDITGETLGTVVKGNALNGLSGLFLCVKQYGQGGVAGAGKAFTKQNPSNSTGFDFANQVRTGDEPYLCPLTRYYYLNGNSANYLNNLYRKDGFWSYLSSESEGLSSSINGSVWGSGFIDGGSAYTTAVVARLSCLVSAIADPATQATLTTSSNVSISGNSATFSAPSSTLNQTASRFVVPSGVTSLTVEAWGGGGGSGSNTVSCNYDCTDNGVTSGGGGGSGGYIKKTIAVTPGQVLYVTVGTGGIGAPQGGWGGHDVRMTYGLPGGISQVLYPDNSTGTYADIIANGGAGGRNYDIDTWPVFQSGQLNGEKWCAGPPPITETSYHACTSSGSSDLFFGNSSVCPDYPTLAACQAANPPTSNFMGMGGTTPSSCVSYTKTTPAVGASNIGWNTNVSGYRYFPPGGSISSNGDTGSISGNPGGTCLWGVGTGSAGGAAIANSKGDSAGAGGGFPTGSGAGVAGKPGKVIIRW